MKLLKKLSIIVAISIPFGAAMAQSVAYPKKQPIKIYVPYAPGGATDALARRVALGLQTKLGQAAVVENKPGAGGIVAAQALANAPADGYTLGIFDITAMTVTPTIYKKPPYDALKAFQPVTKLVENAQIILTSPQSKVTNLKEFIAYAKKNPGTPYATVASVGINMLEFKRLSQAAGIEMENVAYKGSAPLLQDLMAGQIEFAFSDVASAAAYIQSNKVRPIAVSTLQRMDIMPSVPTIAESGFDNFQALAWFGMIAPANVPTEVLDTLNKTLVEIGNTDDFKSWVKSQSFIQPAAMSPKAFKDSWPAEINKFTETARRLNITID
jgi:tripartite-type tricarboxylate transporter receptor subunit TctC